MYSEGVTIHEDIWHCKITVHTLLYMYTVQRYIRRLERNCWENRWGELQILGLGCCTAPPLPYMYTNPSIIGCSFKSTGSSPPFMSSLSPPPPPIAERKAMCIMLQTDLEISLLRRFVSWECSSVGEGEEGGGKGNRGRRGEKDPVGIHAYVF